MMDSCVRPVATLNSVTMDTSAPNTSARTLEAAVLSVGKLLSESFRRVIASLAPGPVRPVELESLCGVGKDLSYRILKATQADDPIAVVHLIPGPAPLRQLVRAAAGRKGVDRAAVADAEAAIEAFDHLIRVEAGDRTTLDSMLAGWLPEARQKVELLSKQAVFRGLSQIKGISADALVETALVHPAGDGENHDGVIVQILRGLRRWRHDAAVRFVSRRIHPNDAESPALQLDGRAVEGIRDLILPEFSTVAASDITIHRTRATESYAVRVEEVGRRSERELVTAEYLPGCLPRYRVPGVSRRSAMFSEVHVPTKLLVFDLLLHRDVQPEQQPELAIFDTTLNGAADVNDPSRQVDRLPFVEHVLPLGQGISGLRIVEAPRYVDVLRTALGRRGWNAEEFRGYRCRIEYPLYGSQVSLIFDRAERGS